MNRGEQGSWHRMTEVDRQAKTGVCSLCGPVRVKLKGKANVAQCMTKVTADKAKWAVGRKPRVRAAGTYRTTTEGRRKHKYKLSPEQVLDRLNSQGGCCAICQTAITVSMLHVDHDHSCCSGRYTCGSCVRGLLCRDCNFGLGWFRDDATRLMRALAYL